MGFFFGSQQSVAAFLVCMEVGRKSERAIILLFPLPLFKFPERRAGVGVFGGSFNRRRHFWYACQRVGRASALVFP